MGGKIILDLCGGSGSWSRPYSQARYDVRNITLPDYDVMTFEPPEGVHGILAAPPCTEFSILNCKAEARERNPLEGLKVVMACMRIIEKCRPVWWAMENPVGHLREYMGPSTMIFQPWEYGDPWTKRTELWGTFTPPPKLYTSWEDVPNKLPLYTRPGRGKPNFAYLHKSAQALIPQLAWAKPATDADFRAITPPGFARAFFDSNRQGGLTCDEIRNAPVQKFQLRPPPRSLLLRRLWPAEHLQESMSERPEPLRPGRQGPAKAKPVGWEAVPVSNSEIFTIPARRCKRCGGLLTSDQALQDGYGPCCLRKIKQEARAKEEAKNQYSLFDPKPDPPLQPAAEPIKDRFGECKTGLSPYGVCVAVHCATPYDCCGQCPESCNSRCGWLPERSD